MNVKCYARHTIMDGKVVTYATGFEQVGRFGKNFSATGPFEISVSRNGIIVHNAELKDTDKPFWLFSRAMHLARVMHKELVKCHGRPDWDQPPESHLSETTITEGIGA